MGKSSGAYLSCQDIVTYIFFRVLLFANYMNKFILNLKCRLAAIVENAPDYAVDIPHFYKYLGETIGPMVYDGALPLNRVKDTLEPLVKPNKAGDVMAEALSVAVQIAGVSLCCYFFVIVFCCSYFYIISIHFT